MKKTKDETITELERANSIKDEELKRKKQTELENIEAREKLLTQLPEMVEKLIETMDAVNARLELLEVPGFSRFKALFDESHTLPGGGRP